MFVATVDHFHLTDADFSLTGTISAWRTKACESWSHLHFGRSRHHGLSNRERVAFIFGQVCVRKVGGAHDDGDTEVDVHDGDGGGHDADDGGDDVNQHVNAHDRNIDDALGDD